MLLGAANLLPPQHGAASAYIPGTDELPGQTPAQVSHLPQPAPLAGGEGIHAVPRRSAHVRCAAQRGSIQGAPERVG